MQVQVGQVRHLCVLQGVVLYVDMSPVQVVMCCPVGSVGGTASTQISIGQVQFGQGRVACESVAQGSYVLGLFCVKSVTFDFHEV